MTSSAQCDECEAILEEIRNASAELHLSPELSAELRDDGEGILRTFGGTEGDFEEGLRKFQFRPQPPRYQIECYGYPRIAAVWHRMGEHRLRTGHIVLFRK